MLKAAQPGEGGGARGTPFSRRRSTLITTITTTAVIYALKVPPPTTTQCGTVTSATMTYAQIVSHDIHHNLTIIKRKNIQETHFVTEAIILPNI